MFCECAVHLLLLLSLGFPSRAQEDCRTYGQPCFDDDSCCGSCCSKGVCKDTYLHCRATPVEDPCTNRYCPEGQVCYTYQPTGCTGCGLLVECRTIPVPEELMENRTLTHHHHFSRARPLKPQLKHTLLPLFALCLLMVGL
ncbi:hypothetical protein HUJ04_013440 [Dendroctonus ponderosae]